MFFMSENLVYFKLRMLDAFYNHIDEIFESTDDLNEIKNHLKQYFGNWDLIRLDIKNIASENNTIKFFNDYNDLSILFPDWLNNSEGKGSVIQSKLNNINFDFNCIGDGNLNFKLRGVDFKNLNSVRIPIYIVVSHLSINNIDFISNDSLISYNENFISNFPIKNNQKINISLKFNTIYHYFPKLKELCDEIDGEYIDLKNYYNFLKNYIAYEKSVITNGDSNICELYKLSEENFSLSKKINYLADNFNNFKEYNEKVLDSYNVLFDSLFKFHNLEPNNLVKYSRDLTMNLLDFIDNVCKKYNMQWWLLGGSLLGAIRHEGYIPWDDDLDIGMLREDYELFLKIIPDELKKYNLHDFIRFKTDSGGGSYHFMKMEYRVDGSLFSFIDLYPFDFIPNVPDNLGALYEKEYWRLHQALNNGKNRIEELNHSFNVLNVSKEKTNILMTGIERNYLRIYEYDLIFPLKMFKFEGRLYPGPNNPKKCLEIFYGGDIMKIPKIVAPHGFYNFLMGLDNVQEILEKHSLFIKKLNDNMD